LLARSLAERRTKCKTTERQNQPNYRDSHAKKILTEATRTASEF
jgi:hypothetical protein